MVIAYLREKRKTKCYWSPLFQKGIPETIPKVLFQEALLSKSVSHKQILTFMKSDVSKMWLVPPILEAKFLNEDA
jgi:hypothetical protein